MGLSELRELIKPVIKDVSLKELTSSVIALDAFNAIYQFLSAIRQPDGTPLMDSKGRITSHLSGLFYRTKNLLEQGIKVIYVFDGKHPEFKKREIQIREELKKKMEEKYKKAIELGIKEDLKKYAQGTSRLTPEMVEDAKKLLDAMGVPWVQAPSEGEAQAAYMARTGVADYTGSQDYDSLLFSSPQVVRNLTITGKRRIRGREVEISPEIIKLEDVLKFLKIDHDQLIWLALLIGTDYNPEGIPNIGLKTAYSLVKNAKDPEKLFNYVGWSKYYPNIDWKELFEFFKDPPVIDVENIEWKDPDEEKIIEILVEEHDFNLDRVKKAIDELKKAMKASSQKTLLSFFK